MSCSDAGRTKLTIPAAVMRITYRSRMRTGAGLETVVLTVDFPLQYPAIRRYAIYVSQHTYPMFGPV
jgi:hypothetical protein